jgi:hypothetical protein
MTIATERRCAVSQSPRPGSRLVLLTKRWTDRLKILSWNDSLLPNRGSTRPGAEHIRIGNPLDSHGNIGHPLPGPTARTRLHRQMAAGASG